MILENKKGENMEKVKVIKEMQKENEELNHPILLIEKLIDLGLFTEKELKLLTDINGLSLKTLNNAMFARYGETLDDLED